ncbi:MAG: cytochrome P450 [Anaerolineae bacterium]|nr:cytochrome P450 [Anaerolineae bacterium]
MSQPIPIAAPPAGSSHIQGLRDNLLAYLEYLASQGDFLRIKLGPFSAYYVNHPDYVREVLVTQASKFHKPFAVKYTVKGLIGENLFSSDGDSWRALRKAMQPAFHMQRISSYTDVMVQYTLDMLESWQGKTTIDIPTAMMDLTMGITTKTLFDVDLRGNRAGDAVLEFLELFNERITSFVPVPGWLPLPRTRRMKHLIGIGDDLLQPIIDERKRTGADHGDLLSMLLQAQANDDTGILTDHQIRNEVLNLFAAGYEVAAYSAAFTLYCIAQHPDVEQRVLAEIDALGGKPITFDDVANLPYLEQVIKEAMRLYPVTATVARQSTEKIRIGYYELPKNATVLVAPWTLHRRPELFPNPEQFDPARFSSTNEERIPKNAYIPFSTGPRICIGNAFAMLQLRSTIATVLQHYRLQIPDTYEMQPVWRFNTRMEGGLPMQISARRPHTV